MLPWSWAEKRLQAARNYWIVTTGADGEPSAAPVWGVWADGAVYFGTNPRSRKGRNLARDPRAVVHLESGDEVVILHGEVELAEIEKSIADAYEAKYKYRPPPRRSSSGCSRGAHSPGSKAIIRQLRPVSTSTRERPARRQATPISAASCREIA